MTSTLLLLSLLAAPSPGPQERPMPPIPSSQKEYRAAIRQAANMVNREDAQRIVSRFGLNLLNLAWEDTARYKNSAVGPNITDLTIQVAIEDPNMQRLDVATMPIIRFPNFDDKTADIDPRAFTLLVGNEKGRALKRVSLHEFLANPRAFMTNPRSWSGMERSLLAPRDSRVLVSAQACFLPVPKQGKATFNPVVFNYQSGPKNPAVLTILATREGTSMTVIDNQRDAFPHGAIWGQRLFHNANGQRASLTGQRLSDFAREQGRTEGIGQAEAQQLSMVLVIQVPLKHRERRQSPMAAGAAMEMAGSPGGTDAKSSARSDTETAVIGHGALEGPFTEVDGMKIERDPRYPVRVTVQFYKATSTGVLSDADAREIRRQIQQVYANGDAVGSLVTEGRTARITEYEGAKIQPPGWWDNFWWRYEEDTGVPREQAIRRLRQLLGQQYFERPVTELYLRDLLPRERK